jgi:hypothetical protein
MPAESVFADRFAGASDRRPTALSTLERDRGWLVPGQPLHGRVLLKCCSSAVQ